MTNYFVNMHCSVIQRIFIVETYIRKTAHKISYQIRKMVSWCFISSLSVTFRQMSGKNGPLLNKKHREHNMFFRKNVS
jgi:hypothetical protein